MNHSPSILVPDSACPAATAASTAPAPTESGTPPGTDANTLPMKTTAPSTETYLPVQLRNGDSLLPSDQAVARPSILTGLELSEETVIALVCFVHGLLRNTLSSDVLYFAVAQARNLAFDNGVSEEEFNRIAKIIVTDWRLKRNQNPMSGLF